ncbi:hypothetical protein GW17_00011635 [Ensete ventricosum]|nr:hypothetical protein GW17_00011635 [Ensete ventricosum]
MVSHKRNKTAGELAHTGLNQQVLAQQTRMQNASTRQSPKTSLSAGNRSPCLETAVSISKENQKKAGTILRSRILEPRAKIWKGTIEGKLTEKVGGHDKPGAVSIRSRKVGWGERPPCQLAAIEWKTNQERASGREEDRKGKPRRNK